MALATQKFFKSLKIPFKIVSLPLWHHVCIITIILGSNKFLTAGGNIMEISSNSLYAQMQSMSLEASGNRLPGIQGSTPIGMQGNEISPVTSSSNNFGNLLKDAIDKVNDAQLESGQLKTAFEMGDRNITLAQTMVASAKAGLAFDGAVQVRNKFVEAYKEVMSMPV